MVTHRVVVGWFTLLNKRQKPLALPEPVQQIPAPAAEALLGHGSRFHEHVKHHVGDAILAMQFGQRLVLGTFQVISPTGKATLQQAPRLRIEVPPNATTANIVADLKGMRLEEIGRHRIEVRSDGRQLGSAPFNVNLVMRQQPGNA